MKEFTNYLYFVKVPDCGYEGCEFEPQCFDLKDEAISFAMDLVSDDPDTRVIVTKLGYNDFDDFGNPDVEPGSEEEIIFDSDDLENVEDYNDEIEYDDKDLQDAYLDPDLFRDFNPDETVYESVNEAVATKDEIDEFINSLDDSDLEECNMQECGDSAKLLPRKRRIVESVAGDVRYVPTGLTKDDEWKYEIVKLPGEGLLSDQIREFAKDKGYDIALDVDSPRIAEVIYYIYKSRNDEYPVIMTADDWAFTDEVDTINELDAYFKEKKEQEEQE